MKMVDVIWVVTVVGSSFTGCQPGSQVWIKPPSPDGVVLEGRMRWLRCRRLRVHVWLYMETSESRSVTSIAGPTLCEAAVCSWCASSGHGTKMPHHFQDSCLDVYECLWFLSRIWGVQLQESPQSPYNSIGSKLMVFLLSTAYLLYQDWLLQTNSNMVEVHLLMLMFSEYD